MKKYIFLLAILFNQIIQINAQTNDSTSKSSFGVNFSFTAESGDFGSPYFEPSIVYNYNNQSFIIGPKFSLDDNSYKGTGIDFTYKIVTNPGKIFNFFFFNHFAYIFLSDNHNVTFYYTSYNPPYTYTVENGNEWSKYYLLNDEIGYGFNLKIYKGLYLNQCIGIGISNSKYNSGFNDNTNPSHSYIDYVRNELNGGVYLNLGIGYNFGSKK